MKLSTAEIIELMGDCEDGWIFDGLVKSNQIINNPQYRNIMCSISGGSDSDIVLDICTKLDVDHKIQYVWFDTGIEYQATKDHLKFLEEKYGIEIIREKAIKPIPYSARKNGQPFVNKLASDYISRLQSHNFQWEDEPFEILYAKYPKCKAALKWWCNAWDDEGKSRFGISNNRWLKEFMIQNPPTFNISAICCKYAKKDVAKKFVKEHSIDLSIMGIRKAEGGVRATAYKTCYSVNETGVDYHRPIFFYSDETKRVYEQHFGINHSRCYTEYGLKRTGCVGCPMNMTVSKEVEIVSEHEPKLYGAINKIFADTYEYTRKYREFQKMMKEKTKNDTTGTNAEIPSEC